MSPILEKSVPLVAAAQTLEFSDQKASRSLTGLRAATNGDDLGPEVTDREVTMWMDGHSAGHHRGKFAGRAELKAELRSLLS